MKTIFNDNDIKIAGNKPSEDIKKNRSSESADTDVSKELVESAKKIGMNIAEIFIEDVESQSDNTPENAILIAQRKLLMSFTATVGFEQYISDDTLVGFAQKSFLDTLKKHSAEMYKSSRDSGAFSFYYLAYRRDNDIERRMGQTFAMLCSHDGDPIFQELGEALFCWFSSCVRKTVKEYL